MHMDILRESKKISRKKGDPLLNNARLMNIQKTWFKYQSRDGRQLTCTVNEFTPFTIITRSKKSRNTREIAMYREQPRVSGVKPTTNTI